MIKRSGLIIGGKEVPCLLPVRNWMEHGMEVKVGRGSRRRHPKTEIDLFVLHWTGGEGSAKGLFRVLNHRALGVEFAVDRDAAIWQFADPVKVDTFDAGKFNPRSVGVEIVNYGFRRKVADIPRAGRKRPLYQTTLNGRKRTFARFTPAQMAAAIALTEAVTDAIPTIPKQIPRDEGGQILQRTMTAASLKSFSGVVGHFHLTKKKSDPGTEIFKALDSVGY